MPDQMKGYLLNDNNMLLLLERLRDVKGLGREVMFSGDLILQDGKGQLLVNTVHELEPNVKLVDIVDEAVADLQAGKVNDRKIKDYCSERILAVLKDVRTYNNMIAEATNLVRAESANSISVDDQVKLDNLQAVFDWVREMQGVCRTLIANDDGSFELEQHWPVPPAAAAALVAEF